MRRYIMVVVVPLLALTLVLQGCAVVRSQAPQLDAKTALALNIGENLNQLNKDYTTFFTDVGAAQRRGQLSEGQVQTLNTMGHDMKKALDTANQVFVTYSANYDQSLTSQIQSYLLTAAQIYASLITQRTQMLTKGAS